MDENKKRITFLDGLRGIAILLVVLFHTYARWPALVPYGDKYASVQIFKYGWLGVDLFFMISGFVILMTLEKTKSFSQFIFRRWLRLFPAMLIISILIFVTARTFFPDRPAGIPVLRDLIPGLTFIEEGVWQKIFHAPQGLLEDAFWSLFVEVKFYFIFGILFFLFGVNTAIAGLVGLFALYVIKVPFMWRFSVEYMGWFAAGALYYQYFKTSEKKWLWMGLAMALASAFFIGRGPGAVFAAVLVSGFFTVVIMNERVQSIVSSRFLVFLGFISYPLYLIHENMMIAMIIKFGHWMPVWMPVFFLPLLPIVILIGIGYLVAAYIEPKLRDFIRGVFDKKSRNLQTR